MITRTRGFALAALILVGLIPLYAVASTSQEVPPRIALDPQAGTVGPIYFLASYDPEITGSTALRSAVARAGGEARAYTQFPVVAVFGDRSVVNAVASSPGVRAIEPNEPIQFYLNSGPHTIGADGVRSKAKRGLGVDGSGVTIGIIDSGTDATHPDLASRLKKNVKVGFTWITCDNDPFHEIPCEGEPFPPVIDLAGKNADTSSGHGTHVAGITAGTGSASNGLFTGVAPGASIDSVGVGDHASVLWALDGFEYLLKHAEEDNIVVINNSWGPVNAGQEEDTEPPSDGNAIRVATEAALSRGISVVFAAGNDGCDESRSNSLISTYALIEGVVSAASSLRDGEGISDFSSCGKRDLRDHDPTVTAPGSDITSARGGPSLYVDPFLATFGQLYTAASGTSMASPHVSGTIALIQSARMQKGLPFLSPIEVKTLLQNTARPIPNVSPRRQGAGMVDAYAAVSRALNLKQGKHRPSFNLCPIVQDLAGDATRSITNTPLSNTKSLDVLSGTLSSTATHLIATIKVTDLDLTEPATAAGPYFDFNFTVLTPNAAPSSPTQVDYFLAAQYSKAEGLATFRIGRYGTTRQILGVGTGSFDVGSDTVTIRVPLVGTGYDLSGEVLSTVNVVSRRSFTVPIVGRGVIADADNAWGRDAYLVGESC